MKKFVVVALLSACVLALAGCANNAGDMINIAEVSELVTKQEDAQEDLQAMLLGTPRDRVLQTWGEPDGMLYGLWGDIWSLGDESGRYIILYYDGDGTVEHVNVGEQ